MADNSIKIKTEIQTKQAEVQLATLENRMAKTASKATALKESMSKLENQKIKTQEYRELEERITKASNELEKLVQKQNAMEKAKKTNTTAYETLTEKIKEVREQLRLAQSEEAELKQAGGREVLGQNTAEYQKLKQQYAEVGSEMQLQNEKHKILTKRVELSRKSVSKLSTVLSKAKKALSTFASVMGKGFKSTGNTLKSSLLTLMKYTLGIQALFALFRKLRSVASEAFATMAKQVPEVNNSISSMKTALNGLKASVGTMLQPLLSAVSGIITQIINKIAQLATAIGSLFASFTGQKYVYKATAAQVDYAKSLDKTGKSAKDTKRQLAGFDELNVINSQDDTSGGGGGGATPTATYAKEAIPDNIKNLADWLKAMWEKADFTELGTLLGIKLKEALENIPWGEIHEVARKIGKSFATLLNGFFEVPDLGSTIGSTLANAFNTVIYAFQSFLQNFHAISFGKFLGDWFNGYFSTVDWGALGNTLGMFVSEILETLIGFIEEADWGLIVDAIFDFLKGINWGRLILDVIMLVFAVAKGLVQVVFELLANIFDAIADFIVWNWNSAGADTVAGFFKGIGDGIRKAKDWVVRQFNEVVDAIKDFLGIHSPSTLFAELGKYCIQGMINGIKSIIGSVVTLFSNAWEAIKAKTISVWASIRNTVLDIISGLWQGLKTVINAILGGIEMMANGIVGGVNKIIDTLNNLDFDIPDWVPMIGGNSVGFNIPHMSNVSIPRLAQGAVIPPNREFMAVLGDQKNGTNIEAPLATIEDALRNVLASQNINVTFQVEGDPNGMFKVIRKEASSFSRRTGNPAFA